MTASYENGWVRVLEEARAGGTATAELPEWLMPLRQAGMDRFAAVGFPAPRDEEWRFTPIRPITEGDFRPAPPAELSPGDLAPLVFGHAEWPRLVFVNGHYAPSLSVLGPLPGGVRLTTLADAAGQEDEVVRAHLARTPRSTEPVHRAQYRVSGGWRAGARTRRRGAGAAGPLAVRDDAGSSGDRHPPAQPDRRGGAGPCLGDRELSDARSRGRLRHQPRDRGAFGRECLDGARTDSARKRAAYHVG